MLRWWKRNAEDEAREKCRAWFRASMHRLLAYARLQVDVDTDVEVLLSGVIERVAEAVAQGRVPAEEEDLLRYSMSSIRHEAIRANRRNSNRREAEQQYFAGAGPEPVSEHPRMSEADAEVRAQHIRCAVQQLPAEQAELIILHIWEELSIAEIARRFRTPESTIRSRYIVALRTMKSYLSTLDIC